MILKLTNKDDNFYNYMGKFFGSRIVQTETKDRIYDDNNKLWYIYVDSNDKACGFASVCDGIIKNIYSNNETYLKKILTKVLHDVKVEPSIVTKLYEDLYQECGFHITTLDNYRHFIMIRGEV